MIRIGILFGLCMVCSVCVALDDSNNTVTESTESARILEQEFENKGDGPYRFSFKTSDGISREESAELIPSIHDKSKNVPKVKGKFSYPGPDGVMYSVNFVADESGFHPEGDHFQVPPFTPWIAGQPIDDGQYKADTRGQYKPDKEEQYKSENVNTVNNVDNSNMPAQEAPKYTSGESIMDAHLPSKSTEHSVTKKYIPYTFKTSQNTKPIIEDVSDQYYRQSIRVTTEYLPAAYTTTRPNIYSTGPVNKAFDNNKPTVKPNLFQGSSLSPAYYTISAEFKNTNYAKLSQFDFPKPFGSPQSSQEGGKYARSIVPENQVKYPVNNKKFNYYDINPQLRFLAGLL